MTETKEYSKELYDILHIPYGVGITIKSCEVINGNRYYHIYKEFDEIYCPECDVKMLSKGLYPRTLNHSITKDGVNIYIVYHQRKRKCPICKKCVNEQISLVGKHSHNSNLTIMLLLDQMKNLNLPTIYIAQQFNISDTEVHDLFTSFVDLPRLPLPVHLSVDEVFLNIDNKKKYAFVMMDFTTGEIVDIIESRHKEDLNRYFYSIPREERKQVKTIISDAYSLYHEFPQLYFPDSVVILDSFHVVSYLTRLLNGYVNKIMKKYKDKDAERLNQKNESTNEEYLTIKESQEVVLLRKYRWVLLKNNDDIIYTMNASNHRDLGGYYNTYNIEKMFFALDKNFERMRDLKEMYISFNNTHFSDDEQTKSELLRLAEIYMDSGLSVFVIFGTFLKRYEKSIVRSFTSVLVNRKTINEQYEARLSNGPMESFNRKPKDLKRTSRGFSNFNYTRNRVLWATRKNPAMLSKPKDYKLVHSFTTKNHYSKKKNNG